MSTTAGFLFHCQQRLRDIAFLEQSYHHALQQLRDKFLHFDERLVKVLNLQRSVDLLQDSLNPVSFSRLPVEPPGSGRRGSSFSSNPFSYSQEVAYVAFVKLIRRNPIPLARSLAVMTSRSLLSRGELDSLAHAIVFDVFGNSRQKSLLKMLRTMLEFLHQERGGLGKNYHLEYNSMATKLLQTYFHLKGNEYLQRVVGPTVQRILTDDLLNLDLLKLSGADTGSDSSHDDLARMAAMSTSPAAGTSDADSSDVLFVICGQLLRRILTSMPLVPRGIRYLAKTLAFLAVPPLDDTAQAESTTEEEEEDKTNAEMPDASGSSTADKSVSSASPVPRSLVRGNGSDSVASLPRSASSHSSSSRSDMDEPLPRASTPTPDPRQQALRRRLAMVGDFVFIHWIVNAINFPETYGLSDVLPISPGARHNLQVIGTVLIKLINGSRFTAFEQDHLNSLNDFLDSLEPHMMKFLAELITLEEEPSSNEASSSDQQSTRSITLEPVVLLPADLIMMHQITLECYFPGAIVTFAGTPNHGRRRSIGTPGGNTPTPIPLPGPSPVVPPAAKRPPLPPTPPPRELVSKYTASQRGRTASSLMQSQSTSSLSTGDSQSPDSSTRSPTSTPPLARSMSERLLRTGVRGGVELLAYVETKDVDVADVLGKLRELPVPTRAPPPDMPTSSSGMSSPMSTTGTRYAYYTYRVLDSGGPKLAAPPAEDGTDAIQLLLDKLVRKDTVNAVVSPSPSPSPSPSDKSEVKCFANGSGNESGSPQDVTVAGDYLNSLSLDADASGVLSGAPSTAVDVVNGSKTPLAHNPAAARKRPVQSAYVRRVRMALDVLRTALCSLEGLPRNAGLVDPPSNELPGQQPSTESVDDVKTLWGVLSRLALKSQLAGQAAKATLIVESARAIEMCLPPVLKARGGWDIVPLLNDMLEKRQHQLKSTTVAHDVLLLNGAVEQRLQQLAQAELEAMRVFHRLQIRRVLEATRPKIRALRKFLLKRNNTSATETGGAVDVLWAPATGDQSTDTKHRSWAKCGGKCPCDLDGDRLLCAACNEQVILNYKTVVSFINKYANDRGPALPPIAASIGPLIQLRRPEVTSLLTDYVVASSYELLFVNCRAADDTFYQLLQALQQRYPTFRDFYYGSQRDAAQLNGAGSSGPRAAVASLPSKLSDGALNAAVKELSQLNKTHSLLRKLEVFSQCRLIVTTMLSNSYSTNFDSEEKGSGKSSYGGADDYMPVLTYVILKANPVRFLSNVQFVETVYPDSLSLKGFVDTLVALKYLLNLVPVLHQQSTVIINAPSPQETVVKQLLQMGFAQADINAGHQLLSGKKDEYGDNGFSMLLDFLTDLNCLRDMGYERQLAMRAIEAAGHNVTLAVQWINAQPQDSSAP